MFKPILLIVFNRPDVTQKVLSAIKKVAPKELFIAADGPRINNEYDIEKCNQVKEIVGRIDWDCNVYKLFQPHNLGCFMGPRTAISWFFSHVEEGIILEDDCLPSSDFFFYCTELLDYYRHNNKILNICGSNMGSNYNDPSGYFFSRFMNMTGWATWKRSADAIDYKLKDWEKGSRSLFDIYKIFKQNIFDADINWYKYWKNKFEMTVNEKNITWWDWQWIYYQLTNKKLSIIPNKNLVTNIGFNSEGTHTKDGSNPLANIPTQKMSFPLHHPPNIKANIKYEEYFVKWVWCYHKKMPFLKWLIMQFRK